MNDHPTFLNSVKALQERINSTCKKCGREPQEVTLMAVTKRHPVEAAEWALEAGLWHLGENRVQELAEKRPKVADKRGKWELIGPLQRNKARLAIQHADRIQTVERIKLARALDRICGEEGRERLPVLMQVNVSGDPAKSGCAPEGARALLEAITASAHLDLEGLMTIGELTEERELIRATFRDLRELRDRLSSETGFSLPVLSMGMTGDLEIAIEEGSTLIRVGTALFGERDPAG